MQKDFNLEVKIWLAVDGTYQFDLKQRLYEVRLERKGSVIPLIFSMSYDNSEPENPSAEECITYLVKRVVLLEDDVADGHDLARALDFNLTSISQVEHFNAHVKEWERWAKWLHANFNTLELCQLYEKYDQESSPLKLI